jgi:hypothetical protein
VEIRLIQGDIFSHETKALILPHYVNLKYLHPAVSLVNKKLDDKIYHDLVNKKVEAAVGAGSVYETQGKLPASNIYLMNVDHIENNEQENVVFSNLEAAIPSVVRRLVDDGNTSCTFLMSTLGTLNFNKAPRLYIRGIIRGLSELKRDNPFELFDYIDFVQHDLSKIHIIYRSINAYLKNPYLEKYMQDIPYLSNTPEGLPLAKESGLKIMAVWRLAKSVDKSDTQGSTVHYDVFISYRRQRDAQAARLLQFSLSKKGLKVFLDVDEIGSGHFDDRLLDTIRNTQNFLVILSPGSLERTKHENDWLRREIEQAITTQRNIIPVMMSGFQFPKPEEMPDAIASLRRHNGIEYSHIYYDAMITQLMKYVRRD